jgi:hypothetical protein
VGELRKLRGIRAQNAYEYNLRRLDLKPGSAVAVSLADTIGELRKADKLPLPGDEGVLMPPVLSCWRRRVSQTDLFLFYRFTKNDVILCALGSSR